MIRAVHLIPLCLALLLLAAPARAQEGFPLRAYYPEVPFITTEQLIKVYDEALVMDIRSSFEYDVAKINKAVLLPLTDLEFSTKLEKLRAKESATPMVFYCNGHTCAKSYQAAQLSLSLGYNNVFVYDAGIFDWISKAPDKATLMGETPARIGRIITSEEFLDRQVNFDEFSRMASEPDTVVIDIRDPFQRDLIPRIEGVRNIPLDPLLDLVVSRVWTEKQLLFFDAVGKQIRWLQYFLESYGYFEYAFLRGGVRSLIDQPDKVKPVIETDRSIVSSQEMLLTLTADIRLGNTDRKVLSYLLANVKFNNYVVVDIAKAEKEMEITHVLLMASVDKLTQCKYASYSEMQGTLIVQVDPRLAWKGKVGSKVWTDKMAEFDATVKK